MRSGAFRRGLGLAFLYAGLLIALVLVQFSRGPGLSEKFGGLSVSATFPKSARGQAGSAPERVRIAFAGLLVELSPSSKAASVGADGATRALALQKVEKLPNGVRVDLDAGVSLTATSDGGRPERISLQASAPQGVAAVRLGVTAPAARLSASGNQRKVTSAGSEYSLSVGAGSFDIGSGTLRLSPGDEGLALAGLGPAAAPKPLRASASDKFTAQAPKDAAAFGAEIAAWRDKAWAGLSGSRFDPDKLTWKGADGLPAFTEPALAAYLAESMARGTFPAGLAAMKAAKDKWPDKLGYLSAPFLGGLVPKMRALEAADAVESKRLAQLVADLSPAVLEKEGLLAFLVDRAPEQLEKDALRLLSGLDPAKLTVRQAVGLLDCSVAARSLLKDEDNPLRDAGPAADRLAAAVRKTARGYFLAASEDGACDLRLSLLAGCDLAAYGAVSGKPTLVGLGQGLVEGAIGLADDQGFSPAGLVISGGAIGQRAGSLAPEDIYPILADNSAYPREESFARALGRGVWAWTCAPSLVAQGAGPRIVFTATFPAGASHYMAIYGIAPFVNIQLYDVDYSPDSQFEIYDASGFLYAKDKAALYLKMRHKKEAEDIKLAF